MIITLRGTSGSGKSTIVKTVMSLYAWKEPVFVRGRKQPLFYKLGQTPGQTELVVLGHYEIACGGCDTIQDFDQIYALVYEATTLAPHVLFEGVLLHSEVRRTVELHNDFPGELRVIQLSTPLEECLRSVNLRRRAKDPAKEDVNPKQTTQKFTFVQKTTKRLDAAGVSNVWMDREEALTYICNLFDLSRNTETEKVST